MKIKVGKRLCNTWKPDFLRTLTLFTKNYSSSGESSGHRVLTEECTQIERGREIMGCWYHRWDPTSPQGSRRKRLKLLPMSTKMCAETLAAEMLLSSSHQCHQVKINKWNVLKHSRNKSGRTSFAGKEEEMLKFYNCYRIWKMRICFSPPELIFSLLPSFFQGYDRGDF